VQEIDCSLVKLFFTDDKISEWLYRGSKRLYTMYLQSQKAQNKFQRKTDCGISYIVIEDEAENSSNKSEASNKEIEPIEAVAPADVKRNIAKKSTARQLQTQTSKDSRTAQQKEKVIILNDQQIYLEDPLSIAKVKHFTPKKSICAKKYVKHNCSPKCIPPLTNNIANFGPLQKPLLTCWERQVVSYKNSKWIIYIAPCGRRLRNMDEIFNFLKITNCFLNVENFDFDYSMQVLSQLVIDKTACPLYIEDISEGKEGMKIPCVNAFDTKEPPSLSYSAHRIPMKGVNINTDPEFLSCCDCTDDCYDKSKCACFQLTIKSAKYKNIMTDDEADISYTWKRLFKVVPTGIYECNSRCKCSSRCLNKVVQQKVNVKMQLYRTKERGWGLEALHDIPKGAFICTYAGRLYTDEEANSICLGQDHGDEYFADLDLIENIEGLKEGYEAGVTYPDNDDEDEAESGSDSDYDDKKDIENSEDIDFKPQSRTVGNRAILTRSGRNPERKSTSSAQRQNSEEESDDEVVNMMPSESTNISMIKIPFRKLYGPKERVYIMDAKETGNIGRYFNVSNFFF
jgi:histone-lysine N-methyltransferase SETDB1